jgi:cytidylate kinase
VVLVGRAAAAVLRRDRDALHVKIVAPFARRVEVVVARDGLPPAEAETRVRDVDENRKRYYRQHYDRDWNDPSQYHLVLNTAFLGIDAVVEIIVTEARRMWPGGVRVATE